MTLCAQAPTSFCFMIYLRLVNVPVMFSCLQIKRQSKIDNAASRMIFKKVTQEDTEEVKEVFFAK